MPGPRYDDNGHLVTHHGPRAPRPTTCGLEGTPSPRTDGWTDVTCEECLRLGAEAGIPDAIAARREREIKAAIETWRPQGFVSMAHRPAAPRQLVPNVYWCRCPACTRDGQHAPMCNVHASDLGDEPCDCPRGRACAS